jgi:hypothetical protein
VYIELIEFLEKPAKDSKETLHEFRERRSKHWWWGTKTGWVDWCLKGGVKDTRASSINQASKLAKEKRTKEDTSQHIELVTYNLAVSGGRKALSGKDLKWKVTFPKGPQTVRGRYPFWCEDETSREWRGEKRFEISIDVYVLICLVYFQSLPPLQSIRIELKV